MGVKASRRTFRIGKSHAVTLPASWCRFYSDRIATVTLIVEDILMVAPQGLEGKAEELMKEVERMQAK